MCSGVSTADMLCLFVLSKVIMNFDQTLGFVTPTSIKAGRCLLMGGGYILVSFTLACTMLQLKVL